jgi:hypothetical protein
MIDNLEAFNFDIYQEIIKRSNVSVIVNLSLVCKNFNVLCVNRQLWISIFDYHNLKIINKKLSTVEQYIREFQKMTKLNFLIHHLLNYIHYYHFKHRRYHRIYFDISYKKYFRRSITNKIRYYKSKYFKGEDVERLVFDIRECKMYYALTQDNYRFFLPLMRHKNIDSIKNILVKILYYPHWTGLYDYKYISWIIYERECFDGWYHNDPEEDKRIQYWIEIKK